MRWLAALLGISALGFASTSLGDFNRTTGLIDIPTAEWLERNVVKVMTHTAFAAWEDEYPAYLNFGLGYGVLGIGEVVLNAYTSKDYSAHLAVRLKEEEDWVPALGLGVQEVTYRKWISSVGAGENVGFPDEVDYRRKGGRPSERFSAYLVATKGFNAYGSYTLGIGRGRFVGYGPHSHWFNTDNFVRENYQDPSDPISDLALGLFMGAQWEPAPDLFLMFEFDGRDANAGVRYQHKYFDVSLAGTHLDQMGGGSRLNPRMALGLSANNSWMYEPPGHGIIAGLVRADRTALPIQATISFPGKEMPSLETTPEGVFTVQLLPGTYVVRAKRAGFYWKQTRVTVSAGRTTRCDFALREKYPPEQAERRRLIREHLNKGIVYFADDKFLEACLEWKEVLKLDPEHTEAKRLLSRARGILQHKLIDGHRAKALGYASRRQLKKAIAEWELVLSIDPENGEARSQIQELTASLASLTSKLPEEKLSPEEINRLFRSGVFLFFEEKYEQAVDIFNEVLKLDPKHEDASDYRDRARNRLRLISMAQ